MKFRPSLAFLTVLAAALWLVPNAAAAINITSTEVTSPAGTRFAIPFENATETITISGTAAGATAGEEVDLRCYRTAADYVELAENVPVEADGSFEVSGAEVERDDVCRLRAVPSGTTPSASELQAFSGPLLATGASETIAIDEGQNSGTTYDYYVDAEGVTGGDDYDSAGDCGLADTYLRSPETEAIETFFCNDYFEGEVDYGDAGVPAEPKESGFTVDGENAYFSFNAEDISRFNAGFPALQWSVTQDPLTGDATLHEEQALVFCKEPGFPPDDENCSEFIESGVRDKRTIEQTHDGHLVVITDEFSSTDGQSHQIVATPDNQQNFGEHAETVEYEFPGESGYTHHAEGESVSFTDSTPAPIYIQAEEAPDGDTETGRGAIVFFQPSSPAYFNFDDGSERNSFYFENHVTVPATGTAPLKYAYASSFEQAEVEALVNDALHPESPPVNPGGGSGGSTSTGTSTTKTTTTTKATTTPKHGKATFRVVKVAHDKTTGTARLEVKTTGPGTLTLTCPRLQTVTKKASKAGIGYLSLKPTPELETLLHERGIAHINVKIQFKANAGGGRTKVKPMHLIYRG